jgi:Tol biopolymer transport system component
MLSRLLLSLAAALLLSACGDDPKDGRDAETPDDAPPSEGRAPSVLRAPEGESWSKPRYSPDGTRIAFIRLKSFRFELMVMREDGTDVRQLTDDTDEVFDFLDTAAWSPDGSRIYFSTLRGVSSVPAEGGDSVVEFTEEGQRGSADIAVSPDGQWLLLSWNNGGLHLYNLQADSGRQLTESGSTPAFSPDGQKVAYLHNELGAYEVRVLTLATEQSVVVTDKPGLPGLDWLPDGRLAVVTEDGISLFDLASSPPQRRRLNDEVAARELDVSPDGRKMVYAIDGQDDLYVLTGY